MNTTTTVAKKAINAPMKSIMQSLKSSQVTGYIERVIIDPSAASFKATIKRHDKFFVKSAKNDVINGIRTTSQMLNDGRIKIGVKCKASQEEFGMYRWDDKAEVDKVVKENDHAMDDIRYFAYTVLKREFKYK